MSEKRDWGLDIALGVVLLLVAALVWGLASRVFTPRAVADRADVSRSHIQVEVLNAAGVDGLARRTREHLVRSGFDVVEIGNGPLRDTTTALVRSGTALDARSVVRAFGLGDDRVVTGGPTTDYTLDVTLYVGADYQSLSPFDD